MSIAQAEKLKRDLTDKYVVVQDGVPELMRFAGLTGQVKTVNMNCRVLVQFDGAVDISWYDIDPSFLKVVAAPQPKAKGAEPAAKPAAEKTEKPKPAAGKSPLELAREQGAAKAEGAAPAAKKLSPLELARQQGAAKPAGASAPPAGEKKLSPLELARQQGAAKPAAAKPPESAPIEQAAAPSAETPAPASPPAAAKPAGPAVGTPKSTAEILALARKQGAWKG